MKKTIYLLAALALCLGLTATSCKKDNNKSGDKASIEDLGGGIYKVNGTRFVDLGLPSGLLWAECNLGASSATAEGSHFAWGETTAKSIANCTKENYKYGTSADKFTKYSEKDGIQTLEADDDAATAALKLPCRTPLATEFQELFTNTTCTWTSRTGSDGKTVYGLEVKSKKSGNTNSIFFPATKYTDKNPQGDYWTANIHLNIPIDYELAGMFTLNEAAGVNAYGGQSRWFDGEIRPVASNLK